MLLSEMKLDEEYSVIKDGVFKQSGFLHQRKSGLFSFLSSKKYLSMLKNPFLTSIATVPELVPEILNSRMNIGVIACSDPRAFILKINSQLECIRWKSIVSDSACIASDVLIPEYNVFIGKNVVLENKVTLYENTVIMDNVFVGSGTILGGRGLMLYQNKGKTQIAKHQGYLYLGSGTKVLYNNVIEKGVFKGDVTFLGKDVVMESNISISHGCRIGDSTVVTSNSKICGYTTIGKGVYCGPGCIISNNITIGEKSNIRIGSVVVTNLSSQADVSSPFASEHLANLFNQMEQKRNFLKVKNNKIV